MLTATLRLAPLPPMAKLDLRAREAMVERFGEALGLPLPTVPLTSAAAGELTLLWLGPDRWLCLGGAVHDGLEAVAAGGFGAVTDVGQHWVGLELAGPAARDVLAAGCRLDLHPALLPVGFASVTLLAKAEVILHRRADTAGGPVFWLFVRRSFADYLRRWLTTVGREFGLEGVAECAPATVPARR